MDDKKLLNDEDLDKVAGGVGDNMKECPYCHGIFDFKIYTKHTRTCEDRPHNLPRY